jgi:CRP/FNR family transcriptional regulator, cyclic AMP receptor protein
MIAPGRGVLGLQPAQLKRRDEVDRESPMGLTGMNFETVAGGASGMNYARMIRGPATLAGVPLFASLEREDVRALDSRCVWRRVSAGEWVVDDRSEDTDVYFVLSGHAHVVMLSPGGEMILRDVRDGEYFGDVSAIDGLPRPGGLRAVTDTVVARMSAAVFHEAIRRYPSVFESVLKNAANMIRSLLNRADEHAHLLVRERLCAELLRLSRTSAAGRLVISPPPTHAQLAARISTRREAVTRLLKALELDGAITRTRSAIALVKPEYLRRAITAAK